MKKLSLLLASLLIFTTLTSCATTTPLSHSNQNKYESDGDYYYSNQKEIEIYHTVQFQTNGGEAITAKSIKDGGQISSAPTTTRDGYLFEGWFMDSTFTQGAVFPLVIVNDTTIYAKWLKLSGIGSYVDSQIDASVFSTSSVSYSLTPNGFNMERLQELDYRMKITVSYEVSYEKSYTGLNIFYAGAPKFETYIKIGGTATVSKEDQTAPTNPMVKTLEYTAKISDIMGKDIKLEFSSDNCQNIVVFENITVAYECFK